jgi:large subunit ribosomal protein L1
MLNPKLETVSDEIIGAVHEVKEGCVEFKMDRTANMAVVMAKRSFAADKLAEKIRTAIDSIVKAKPTNVSGNCIPQYDIDGDNGSGNYSVVLGRTL